MKAKKLTKELADELMKIKGETRGFNLEHDTRWILKNWGEEGLKKVERKLKRVGYPIEYKKLKIMDFYPAGLRAISLLAIKEVFNLDKEGVRNVCAFHPKISLVMKLFAKYFYSIPVVMDQGPNIWKKYWTVGELVSVDYNKEKKHAIFRIKEFDLHPTFCNCMEGYFKGAAVLVLRNREITCEETKCTFRGDEYHEFLLKW